MAVKVMRDVIDQSREIFEYIREEMDAVSFDHDFLFRISSLAWFPTVSTVSRLSEEPGKENRIN